MSVHAESTARETAVSESCCKDLGSTRGAIAVVVAAAADISDASYLAFFIFRFGIH